MAQSIKIKEILEEISDKLSVELEIFISSASIKVMASCPFVADIVGYPSFAN